MSDRWIENFDALARTPARRMLLEMLEAGFDAIDTEQVIAGAVSLSGTILKIQDKEYDLSRYARVMVVGFGKTSCRAASALEAILGDRITDGVIIDLQNGKHSRIRSIIGTHPKPSMQNVLASRDIVNLARDMRENDLVLVIVSGGGSALLCYPESECAQGEKLYDAFLGTGAPIQELNLVRKHISSLKGGGLAKLFYPATIVGLIFSDVPGDDVDQVASGPTFKDETTISDAQKILDIYNIHDVELIETPKDDRFFERVTNICVVSSEVALRAMQVFVSSRGYSATILSVSSYDAPPILIEKIFTALREHDVVLCGGEASLVVTRPGGKGGRNAYVALTGLHDLPLGVTLAGVASDGLDNSDAAGAIIDGGTAEKMRELNLDIEGHLARFDVYTFFEDTKDLIFTGQTGANVSDFTVATKLLP